MILHGLATDRRRRAFQLQRVWIESLRDQRAIPQKQQIAGVGVRNSRRDIDDEFRLRCVKAGGEDGITKVLVCRWTPNKKQEVLVVRKKLRI